MVAGSLDLKYFLKVKTLSLRLDVSIILQTPHYEHIRTDSSRYNAPINICFLDCISDCVINIRA